MSASPWLDTADAAELLRFKGKTPHRSVYKFIKRHGLVARRDGHRLLLAKADVLRALEGDRVRVHARQSASVSGSTVNEQGSAS